MAHKERVCAYWHCSRTGGTECWNWGSRYAGKKCPQSDACEHWRTWRKTPYQITTLFKYHKEYNPHIFRQEQAGTPAATENMDDIDIALGGF